MIAVYTLERCEQWDAIVRTFREYDVYWLSGYVKAFWLHGDGIPLLITYDDGKTRGINVVMKRDIAKDKGFEGKLAENTLFDFSTPYGYGGWLIEGENSRSLFQAYNEWCAKNFIVSEFVRFHPVLENHNNLQNEYDIVSLGNTVILDLSSPELIWGNITSKNRNMIRKAQKSGVKIYSGRCPEIYQEFKKIYDCTMDRDEAKKYYYFDASFYKSVCDDLPYNSQVFYAEHEGRIIAASIMLLTNGRMSYHLSGSIKEYAGLAPTNLLLYEAAMCGYASGCKTFLLGGGVGSCEDSLFKFKKSFNRRDENLRRFNIGRKIFCDEIYDQLLIKSENTRNSDYFPAYRFNR